MTVKLLLLCWSLYCTCDVNLFCEYNTMCHTVAVLQLSLFAPLANSCHISNCIFPRNTALLILQIMNISNYCIPFIMHLIIFMSVKEREFFLHIVSVVRETFDVNGFVIEFSMVWLLTT